MLDTGGGWLTPAFAGNTRSMRTVSIISSAHPRIRGEYDRGAESMSDNLGSPPHSRGIQSGAVRQRVVCRLTPAFAGNTASLYGRIRRRLAHPRIRGEYDGAADGAFHRDGSPPHSRGIRLEFSDPGRPLGLTPAFAGNTDLLRHLLGWGAAHPRIRGEYRVEQKRMQIKRGSPPHSRGIRWRCKEGRRSLRLTPAFAGNTHSMVVMRCSHPAHPRIRGEYGSMTIIELIAAGSPPHSRGIPGS